MERQGWRAIIYDAPWARFASGQSGVIISDDGKTCETVNDDVSSIIVEADKNTSFNERDNGHILFRQKGSDLFDVVCLYQRAGGTYELEVENVTIDGCVGKDYGSFIRDLVIYEIENGNRRKVTGYENIKSMLVKPTAIDASNNFKNNTSSPITMPITVSNDGATASATLTITPFDSQTGIEEYDRTEIIGLNSVTITKKGDGSSYCNIYMSKTVDCEGGTFKINVNQGTSADPTYELDFSGVSAILHFNVIKCGVVISSTTRNDTITYRLMPKDGVSLVSSTSNSMLISAANGVSSITVIMETGYKGIRQEITKSIPS